MNTKIYQFYLINVTNLDKSYSQFEQIIGTDGLLTFTSHMCFPVTEYRREGKRMRCQVKGIGIFTFKGGEKMYKPKLLCGGGGGGGRVVDREGKTMKDA